MVSIRHNTLSSNAPLALTAWDAEHTITGMVIADVTGLQGALDAKQSTLVSGTNIKTINGVTVLGSGDIVISSGGSPVWGGITGTLASQTDLQAALNARQPLATVLTNTTAAFTTAQESKLAGIATGATANAADAELRDRTTHTGAQAIATVTGLQTALDGKAALGANADITSLRQSVTLVATGTISADSLGFRGLPANPQTAAYTLALTDAGRMVNITTGGVTIPANATAAFPIGTAIAVYNDSATPQDVAITTDTLRLAGTETTGTRTLAGRGIATLVKVAVTEWVAQGNIT